MIVAANQPYFAPYTGFFEKGLLADVMVLLDAVQFPRGTTWMSRNRFKNDQGTLWLTIPVWKKHLGLQAINAVNICHEGRWVAKHLRSLQQAYAHAPYFESHAAVIRDALTAGYERLLDLNLVLIKYVWDCLSIDCRLLLQSELGITAKGDRLIVEVCRTLGADAFMAQKTAHKHIDSEMFHNAGIELQAFNPTTVVYPQLWGHFIANLSVFDALFNCGPKVREWIG